MNIYVHIPFCHSKCAYCAFLSHCDTNKEDEYIAALCSEIRESIHLSSRVSSDKNERVEGSLQQEPTLSESRMGRDDGVVGTIYFGGGTPSMVNPQNITRILGAISSRNKLSDDIEITLECNPEDISVNNLQMWQEAGINRLSIGVQTLNDETRKKINRPLTADEVIKRVGLAKKHFQNVGVDLMAGLPGDDRDNIFEAINTLAKLRLDHISLYDLETDNDSLIARFPDRFPLLSEDSRADTLLTAWDLLVKLGYEQYEISNFAREKQYCRHNLDFWNGKDYLGFGLGSVSRLNNQIITNTKDFQLYISGKSIPEVELLNKAELDNLALISAMRLNRSFQAEFEKVRGNDKILGELIGAGFIYNDTTLTPKGKILYNQITDKLLT